MNDKSTFTPDPATVKYLLQLLEGEGIQFSGCTWGTRFQGLHLDEGHLVAENHITAMADGKFYRSTLVTKTKLTDGSTFRSLMLIENSGGRDKIGDVVVEVRLDPSDGRYKVYVQLEQVFSDEGHFIWLPRAARSSVDNPDQALHRRVIDLTGDGIRSNPARIAGVKIAQHFSNPGWGANLPAEEFMDVYDYVHTTDAMGQSTLLKGLQAYDAEIANEVFAQIRDPERHKK